MPAIYDEMAKRKTDDRHKPRRMTYIPEAYAVELEKLAGEEFNSITDHVRIAVREYLTRLNRMPAPKKPPK